MTIWERSRQIDKARREKMEEAMADYDKEVYYPAKKLLFRECFLEGHEGTRHHDNGFGWSWIYCNKCGGRFNIEGPNGEKSPDSGEKE